MITQVQTPARAVKRAMAVATFERNVRQIADSLFDTIVVKEIGPATLLANRMLGDYATAADAVYVALDRAHAEFDSYDGIESPRTWVLRYVAEETLLRSAAQQAGDRYGAGAKDALNPTTCLRPRHRLAVVLTDSLGMTEEAAATVAGVDVDVLRKRLNEAWSHLGSPGHSNCCSPSDMAAD